MAKTDDTIPLARDEMHAAFAAARADPAIRLLGEIEVAESQKEAAEVLALSRDLLNAFPSLERTNLLSEINKLIDEKPVI